MITVYFVRHGQSKDNKAQIHQGSNTPLSDRGRYQAGKVAKRLKDIPIDRIYSSPHKRTKQTAKIISKEIGKHIEYWGEIREVPNPKELIGISFRSKQSRKIRGVISRKEMDPNWKYSDNESFNEQKERALKVIKHIEDKHKNQSVLCVSHGTVVKLLLSVMIYGENVKPKEFYALRDKIKINHTGLTMCKFFKKEGWKVISVNDIVHL